MRLNPYPIFVVLVVVSCSFNQTESLLADARELDSLRKFREAIAIYDRVLEKEPTHISALLDRAFDKGQVDDEEGQIRDLKTILRIDSANTLALYNLGIAYGNTENYVESINAFNKAMQTKGGEGLTMDFVPNPYVDKKTYMYDVPTAEILLERGIAYYELDSLRKAYFDLTFCIDNHHNLKESYGYRGRTFLKAGMMKQACEDLKMAEMYGDKGATSILNQYCR